MSKVRIIKETTNTGGGAVYVLGFVGAVVYYWQHAETFWQYVLGVLQAAVWPALLIHKVLTTLGM